jgi:hypothetical protein
MIESVANIVKQFLHETRQNQLVIVLVALIAMLIYDRQDTLKKQSLKDDELRVNDSLALARYNSLSIDFKNAIKDCEEARHTEYKELVEKYQEKLEEVFKTTDKLYHKTQINN